MVGEEGPVRCGVKSPSEPDQLQLNNHVTGQNTVGDVGYHLHICMCTLTPHYARSGLSPVIALVSEGNRL